MEKDKKIKKISIISFFVISILGTIFHFVYDLSSNNLIIGAFFPVNESVWEHLKLLAIPMFLVAIYEYKYLNKDTNNFFIALLSRVVVSMLFVVTSFYVYTSIFKQSYVIADILIFFASVLVSQIVWYNIIKREKISDTLSIISVFLSILILILFVLFTYLPPRGDLFKDNTNNSYGIFKIVD